MRDLARPVGEPPPVDPDAARDAADDILSRPEYQEPQPSLLDRAVDWLFDRLGDLFDTLTGSGPGSVVAWVVLGVLVLGAVVLLVRALQVPLVGGQASAPGAVYGTESGRDASVWSAEAARLAEAGDHRGAIRCRHQALIARLITEEVVEHVPGRTAAEHRDDVLARLPVDGQMRPLTELFEETWYGRRPAAREDFERFTSWCEAVEAHSGDTRPAGPVLTEAPT